MSEPGEDTGADHPLHVYHLALAADWAAAQVTGQYRVSTLGADLDEVGFIHASFAEQLAGTAARFYRGVAEPMVVLVIDTTRLACPVVVEPVPGGDSFPHVYGPVPTSAVAATRSARMVDGHLQLFEG